ncbi:MAG: acyl-CoA dehydrogenase family protein, partial [Bacteroidota bacterium]
SDFATRRVAFGAPLARQPLHVDTLAGLHAEAEAAFHLVFFLVELIGRDEAGELDEEGRVLLRVLTSIVKLTTARQAVSVASEVLEAFGGAGYVEDTGLPALLRDSQVFPIWEGTTNVLSLDVLRALSQEQALDGLARKVDQCLAQVRDPALETAAEIARRAVSHAGLWAVRAAEAGKEMAEAGARRLAMTLGRGLALVLLIEHAQWALDNEQDERPRAAARRFARSGIDLIADIDPADSALLLQI